MKLKEELWRAELEKARTEKQYKVLHAKYEQNASLNQILRRRAGLHGTHRAGKPARCRDSPKKKREAKLARKTLGPEELAQEERARKWAIDLDTQHLAPRAKIPRLDLDLADLGLNLPALGGQQELGPADQEMQDEELDVEAAPPLTLGSYDRLTRY